MIVLWRNYFDSHSPQLRNSWIPASLLARSQPRGSATLSNPTCRLWTAADLEAVRAGDTWLTTLLVNVSSFTHETWAAYSHARVNCKTYSVFLTDAEYSSERVVFYATDDENAMRYVRAMYVESAIHAVDEVITTTREIYHVNHEVITVCAQLLG